MHYLERGERPTGNHLSGVVDDTLVIVIGTVREVHAD